ncbi:MAG: hypothetical protein AAGA18_03375 [Verrucomicrobiota bacterium]
MSCTFINLNPYLIAGSFAPAAGQPGSTAIAVSDSSFVGWATGYQDFVMGPVDISDPGGPLATFGQTVNILGKADSDGAEHPVLSLGDGGSVVLTFDSFIYNGPGADFAVFENSFSDTFLELAYVEVSSNGIDYFRFPSVSETQTATQVNSFGVLDPTELYNFAGKYRAGFGTPFDLEELKTTNPLLDVDRITHIKIIDAVGSIDNSYATLDSLGNRVNDPWKTPFASGGFDLDAVGVIHAYTWQVLQLPDLPEVDGINVLFRSPKFDHLMDGRFLYGHLSELFAQDTWGEAGMTQYANGPSYDPAFIAVKDDTSALIGAGGTFGQASEVTAFNPSDNINPSYSALAGLQNFDGVYWKSSLSSAEGWLIAGTNGSSGQHALSYISLDGLTAKVVIDSISTFSSGIATDHDGNVYVSTFELSQTKDAVYRFSTSQMESAITGAALVLSDGVFQVDFTSAGSLAVDGQGRIWAGGFKADGFVEVYEPKTGGLVEIAPEHPVIAGAGSVMYQIQIFSRANEEYIAFLARDAFDVSEEIYYVYANVDAILPSTITTWQRWIFGDDVDNPSLEATLWGNDANPDGDDWTNLEEYAFCLDPQEVDGSNLIGYQLTTDSFRISFPRRYRTNDLRMDVEVSNDLLPGSWDVIARSERGNPMQSIGTPGAGSITENLLGGLVETEVEDGESFFDLERRFMRINVQLLE